MGLWWGKGGECAGCDEAAASAAGASGDSGGGATSPSPSSSSTSSTSATTSTATPSTPRSPRSTASSTSPPQSPTSWTSSSHEEFDQFDNSFGSTHLDITDPEVNKVEKGDTGGVLSSNSKLGDKEIAWGEEQEFDQLNSSFGITQQYSTHTEVNKVEKGDTGGVLSSNSKLGDKEIAWGEEQEFDQLNNSFGSTQQDSTHTEVKKDEKGDTGGVLNGNSKIGDKEPLLTLDNYHKDTLTGQIMLLSKKYGFFRRLAGDGSCFYRAFIFSYLENVVETNDEAKRKAEAARLRKRVKKCMRARNSDELLPTFYGFESMVNLIEQGLASGELYHMEKNEHVTSKVLPLLRSLTEIELCSREDFYHPFLGGIYESVFELCFWEVRPANGEANHIQIAALANALGIPIIVENLDENSPGRLNTDHMYPRRESEAEALEQEQSVDSDDSTTHMAQVEHDGSRKLSPAERRRLVTLLYRPGHYDIIYPK